MEPARLDQIPLFADLSAEERAEVAACLREVTVDAGTALATQVENAYELFVIEEGDAEVRKDGELVWTLGAGDVFGEIGLLATGTPDRLGRRDVPDAARRDVLARVQAAGGPRAGADEVPARDDGRARRADQVLTAAPAGAAAQSQPRSVAIRTAWARSTAPSLP
jgi:CRP-like cAMP-binding protein